MQEQQSIGNEGTLKPIFSLVQNEILRLSKFYEFEDENAVKEFIADNSFLLDILFAAPLQIENYFGKDIKLALKLFCDPEEMSSQELFILIESRFSTKEAFARLERLVEEWWLDEMDKANCKLTIDLK